MTDPGFLLFGKKIGFRPNLPPFSAAVDGKSSSQESENNHLVAEKACSSSHDQRKDETDDNPKTPSIDEELMSENLQSTDGETISLQPRTLKKPDKILACPRCDSMNTKFCYFNNSNINQPRHFCKSCQRYWTAGGTMRNMPVGAGRRKKKTPPSNYRYIISQEALESTTSANQIEFAPDSNRNVLSFGRHPPSHVGNGKENQKIQDNNGFHSQVHWIPGGSWPYNPWNTPIPITIPPSFPPIPMYPSPYWSSVSWLPPPPPPASAGSILGKHSTDEEPVKANGSHEQSKKQRNTILIPKTLRIDDPDEAAKSSIWATLGINNEHSSRGDLFKAFQAKGNEKKKISATEPEPEPKSKPCPILQANPAAFSRSLWFQERA